MNDHRNHRHRASEPAWPTGDDPDPRASATTGAGRGAHRLLEPPVGGRRRAVGPRQWTATATRNGTRRRASHRSVERERPPLAGRRAAGGRRRAPPRAARTAPGAPLAPPPCGRGRGGAADRPPRPVGPRPGRPQTGPGGVPGPAGTRPPVGPATRVVRRAPAAPRVPAATRTARPSCCRPFAAAPAAPARSPSCSRTASRTTTRTCNDDPDLDDDYYDEDEDAPLSDGGPQEAPQEDLAARAAHGVRAHRADDHRADRGVLRRLPAGRGAVAAGGRRRSRARSSR